MNRKNKKWIMPVGILLFFLAGGVWYLLQGRTTGQGKTKADIIGVLEQVQSEDTLITPAATGEPETVAPTNEEPSLVVFVCGAVMHPGVYELPEGSRLFEAVELAGGFTEDADTSYHNLARGIADGERIYILTCSETEAYTAEQRIEGEPASESGAHSSDKDASVVNLNTATLEQLTTLPGIGQSKAESIIEYRTKVGKFTDIEEVMNISGIGEAMFDKIKDKITVK